MIQSCPHLALTLLVCKLCRTSQLFIINLSENIATEVYYEKLHSLTVKNIIIWHKFLLLLDRLFSEFFGTNFNPQFFKDIEVGLKLFFICTLEMLVGAL